jgi:hypothetical protein
MSDEIAEITSSARNAASEAQPVAALPRCAVP